MAIIPVPENTQLPEDELQLYMADRVGYAIGRHVSAVLADEREYIVRRGPFEIKPGIDIGPEYPQNAAGLVVTVTLALADPNEAKVDELATAGPDWPKQVRGLHRIHLPNGRAFERAGRYWRRVK